MKFIKNNYLFIIMAVVIFNVIAIGISLAYFTNRTEEKLNVFTVGNVNINVREDNFDKESAKTVTPNEEIDKDPYVVNVGSNSAYVFMMIEVPRKNVIIVDTDNVTLKKRSYVDLFTYNVNSSWQLISSDVSDESSIYVYAYMKGVLQPDDRTDAIFDKVKFANVLEGEISSNDSFNVVVSGYAVQSDSLEVKGSTDLEKMTYIYTNYLK